MRSGRIPLRPGVARLVGELRAAGVRLAIATTTAPSSVHSLLETCFGADAGRLFEVIGAGDQVAGKKPLPDIYAWVLRQLALPARSCLAVEDSHIGLRAAQSAGLATLVTVSTYTVGEDFRGALSVVSDLGEAGAPARHIAGLPLAGKLVDLAQLRLWQQRRGAGDGT